jgi:hypothetical protein
MLTPIDFKNNYSALLDESKSITGLVPYATARLEYEDVTENDKFTSEQWDNLVKVASIIKANEFRFEMNTWHKYTECGTVHCIAGWAESLAKNDTNYSDPSVTWITAERMLSEYAKPFFFVAEQALIPMNSYNAFAAVEEKRQEHKGLPEKLVMKWFIDPILEEARKESHQLSSEITQFIQRTQQEQMSTCGV